MNKNILPETTGNNLSSNEGFLSVTQVIDLLVAVQLYSNGSNNQGLLNVAGENYGERAQTMLNSFLTSNSHVETVGKFKIPLDEYMS